MNELTVDPVHGGSLADGRVPIVLLDGPNVRPPFERPERLLREVTRDGLAHLAEVQFAVDRVGSLTGWAFGTS